MFGIGAPELIVIFIILLSLILPYWLSVFLRKKSPGKIWIGLLLSFIFTALGQYYVEGAGIWVIILFICILVFKGVFGDILPTWLLTSVLSSVIMYYRLLKTKGPK